MDARPSDPPQPKAFLLGEWLVEPSRNRVTRGDTSHQLELKVMNVLVCLAEHAGQVVSKTQIIDEVWQTEFISVNTLTHAIAELRRVLGDEARCPRYIETITKRGYRLMKPIEDPATAARREPSCSAGCFVVLAGRQTNLQPGENLLGRAADTFVRIDDPEVSRHHARIVVAVGGVFLDDLGSKNGTFLRGKRLTTRAPLEDGDEICIGSVLLVFRHLAADDATRTATEAR